MDKSGITYAPRPETTPDAEISALGNVYRFILDCHAKKAAPLQSRPDAGKEINERSGKVSILK